MRPTTFDCSKSDRWVESGARLGVGLVGAAVIAWGACRGVYGLFGAAALLGGSLLWVIMPRSWRSAWRVVASDEGIEAARPGSRRVRLTWDGIGDVQYRTKRGMRGPVRLMRLVSIDRQGEIVFNDRWPQFEELLGLVEAHVRHVDAKEATSWSRSLWPKSSATPARGGKP